jgi:enoyl-CoA hydratase/carnithine racemase
MDRCKCVILLGAGDRAFCAGGDVKALARWIAEEEFGPAEVFFKEEYALDLSIHRFPKPIVVVADGITMGGGLGLAAGADVIIATERTRMAMPETAIGFFPDVGATGWLFSRCSEGYPEYIGLTGYELNGEEAVRCGLATHLVASERVAGILEACKDLVIPADRRDAAMAIRSEVERHLKRKIPEKPSLDAWVKAHFSQKTSLKEILDSLEDDRPSDEQSGHILKTLAERSPTSLVLTFALLKLNRGQPLEKVFDAELKAARHMIRHPDYLEGVRAQVLDKDHQPRWQPNKLENVTDVQAAFM